MEDDEKAEIIMALDNPQEMKELGKQMKDIDSAVWKDRCQEVVEVGNMAKVIYIGETMELRNTSSKRFITCVFILILKHIEQMKPIHDLLDI